MGEPQGPWIHDRLKRLLGLNTSHPSAGELVSAMAEFMREKARKRGHSDQHFWFIRQDASHELLLLIKDELNEACMTAGRVDIHRRAEDAAIAATPSDEDALWEIIRDMRLTDRHIGPGSLYRAMRQAVFDQARHITLTLLKALNPPNGG